MRPISGKRMRRILESRGWVYSRMRGSHAMYEHAESPFTIAVPVHGNKDLSTGVQKQIMRQAGLNHEDL